VTPTRTSATRCAPLNSRSAPARPRAA
jgi:hypothetical protein